SGYLVQRLESDRIVSDLLLVPLEDTVVFPGMTVTLTVDTGDETEVLLVPQHGQEYAKVGTFASRSRRSRTRIPLPSRRVSWSASTAPSSRRSSSCATPTSASDSSCAP